MKLIRQMSLLLHYIQEQHKIYKTGDYHTDLLSLSHITCAKFKIPYTKDGKVPVWMSYLVTGVIKDAE